MTRLSRNAWVDMGAAICLLASQAWRWESLWRVLNAEAEGEEN